MICNNLKELEKEIQDRIDVSLLTDVSDVVKDVMIDHIYSDVYDEYNPIFYTRRYNDGGLGDRDNIYESISGDTLIIENHTQGTSTYFYGEKNYKSRNAGKDISGVIETGIGYDVTDWVYSGVPRPFIANTRDDIKSHKYHIKALKNGLKGQGLEVK